MLVTLILTLTVTTSSVFSLDDGSHYTNSWVVDFKPELSEKEINEIAQSYGFLSYGKIFEDKNLHELHHPRIAKRSLNEANEHSNILENHVHILSAVQQIGRRRVKRDQTSETPFSVRDPLWSKTWYLNRGVSDELSYDMNVISAWKKGFTGKNVVVTILDDGIEHDHPDLKRNYDPSASTDINARDDDPMPRYDYSNENRHGTRCAGEVAAEANNTVCSVGVAYDAFIGGIRMLDGSVTDSVEALSLGFNRDHVDIYSSSWGPDDNGRTVDGPSTLATQAFVNGVTKGRNGKGNIFVWATGNGGRHRDSCACDGYVNNIYTVSVSSVSEHNQPPWYLEECASTLASTYSSGSIGIDKQIVTTDLRKTCTATHTGTSASAPMAAGLIAVMLEANPQMTWRDVQYVIIAAANPDPILSSGQFRTNGVGRKYSHKFGYGLMDCGKMVELAQDWTEVPPQLIKHLPEVSLNVNLGTTYSTRIEVPSCSASDTLGCIRYLEHVQMVLIMSSTRRGRLSVKLRSPLGTESTILPLRSSDSSAAGFSNWPFMSVHFWGEDPSGTWELLIDNQGNSGYLKQYQLVIYGVSAEPFSSNRTLSSDFEKCGENSHACHRNAECSNTAGSHSCTCKAGYSGDGIRMCEDINECEVFADSCQRGADCINTRGSYKCICKSGSYVNGFHKCEGFGSNKDSSTGSKVLSPAPWKLALSIGMPLLVLSIALIIVSLIKYKKYILSLIHQKKSESAVSYDNSETKLERY